MKHESHCCPSLWQDVRGLLCRISRIYAVPLAYDLFARIAPGLLLLWAVLCAKRGLGVTWGLMTVFSDWLLLYLAVLFVAWLLGMALLTVARWVWYAKPVQPDGWDKYLWLEGLVDFENRAPLGLRRKAGWARILADGSAAAGLALIVALVLATFTQTSPDTRLYTQPAWIILVLFVATWVLILVHLRLGARWALLAAAVLALLLLVTVTRLERIWMGPILLLLVGIVGLRFVHKVFRKKWQAIVQRVVRPETVMTSHKATPIFLGPQGSGNDDGPSSRSKYRDVHAAVLANPYYTVWGIGGQRLPVYRVTLASVLRGILHSGLPYQFRAAAERTVDSRSVLRPGPDGRGYRRLLHPNGVCLFGRWKITEDSGYTGYFRQNKEALVVARYSTCCTETRRGRKRSLSLVGKLYPTTRANHADPLPTANFITQQDLGGERDQYINDAEFRNAPDATVWRRGLSLDGLPVILLTGLLFRIVDREPANRQLYEIAELGEDGESKTPQFMRIVMDENQPRIPGDDLDFRDEVLAQIYNPGDPDAKRKLVFHIEVSDTGKTIGPGVFQRRKIDDWRRIGQLIFEEAVASYNGDFVLHFHHPGWREKRDDPDSAVRPAARGRQDRANLS